MISIKRYLIRITIVNFFSLFYLIETSSFDYGFFSIQSIFYSINIYLLYFFLFFETLCSYLSLYGLDFNFYKLIIKNLTSLNNLNFGYLKFILYQNINFIYFLIFSLVTLIFFEKKKYNINFKINSFNFKKFATAAVIVIIFILTNFNPSHTHLALINKYKSLTNNWTSNDFFFNEPRYYKQLTKNNLLRNDNWYDTLRYSFYYSDTNSAGGKSTSLIDRDKNFKSFRNFAEVIQNKEYNNIFVIINESYPNFRDQKLKNSLIEKIMFNNDDLIIKTYKKKWNRSVSTHGSEMEFFCNKDVNLDKFVKAELKTFINNNNCWINSIREKKNFVYIHTFYEFFFNRKRYKSFFDKSFFREDLEQFNFKTCDQLFNGICDYEILNNMDKLIPNKDNNFVFFLTVNNHIPTEPYYENPYIDCKANFILNLNEQFCILYNNQMLFNASLSEFLSSMGKDDLLVFFSDTPPMFAGKKRIHFEDTIDIYFFSKT
tara:strand:+ start:1424 stop:2884 length:1461 start_codon:yes stop_codon:yes gene_type:complete